MEITRIIPKMSILVGKTIAKTAREKCFTVVHCDSEHDISAVTTIAKNGHVKVETDL